MSLIDNQCSRESDIFIIVAVVMVTICVIGAGSQAIDGCTVTWSCQNNTHAYYGILFPGCETLDSCLSCCATNTSCIGVDFDTSSTMCYTFSSTALFCASYPMTGVHHCAVNRVCNPPTSTSTTTQPSTSISTTTTSTSTTVSTTASTASSTTAPTTSSSSITASTSTSPTLSTTASTTVQAYTDCTSGSYGCLDGPCMDNSVLCNGIVDCPYGDDEFNCSCSSQQYSCYRGPCIDNSLVCDGVYDCAGADDESPSLCRVCSANQFQCTTSYECISSSQRCDGSYNCADKSDELNCVSFLVPLAEKRKKRDVISQIVYPSSPVSLSVSYKGKSNNYVCADGWNQLWSDLACQDMGFARSSSVEYVNLAITDSYVELSTGLLADSFVAGLSDLWWCASHYKIALNCFLPACGWRTVGDKYDATYVNSGSVSSTGAWPWHVAIFYNDVYLCAGSVVAPNWILTSARCTSSGGFSSNTLNNFAMLTVRAGSTSLSAADPITQVASVDLVVVHPSFGSNLWGGDLGLLRLTQPLQMTSGVQVVCLPPSSVEFYHSLGGNPVCAVAGWTPAQSSVSQSITREDSMRQVRVKPLSGNVCGASAANDTSLLCIDQTSLTNNSTIGMGAGMVCRDVTGTWFLSGVVMGTLDYPNYSSNPLTNVAFHADWITSFTMRRT